MRKFLWIWWQITIRVGVMILNSSYWNCRPFILLMNSFDSIFDSLVFILYLASKMKSVIAITLFLGVVCVAMGQQISSKFTQSNVDAVLNNDRVLTNYLKCLLDQGSCTREGRELKSKWWMKNHIFFSSKTQHFPNCVFLTEFLPDAILTNCSQCTPAQKKNSQRIINFLQTRRRQDWAQLMNKYDPQGVQKRRLEAGLV